MTLEKIIRDVIATEGNQQLTNDPADTGGKTIGGISEKWNPEAWKDGPPSPEKQREIYMQKYVLGPGFDKIADKALQAQLVDFGVNSGPAVAIKKLQKVLAVTEDGVLGPQTLAALKQTHPDDVNNCLVAERVRMIGKIVSNNPTQLRFINGWLDRAVQFLS